MATKKSKNKQVAVLGYGSQGRSIALNLRDSGYDVIIGLKSKSKSRKIAQKDGFKTIITTGKAVLCPIIIMALPDHLQGRIYQKEITPNLIKGSTLLFLHGFSVHFGFVVPPKQSDVILIAPHAPGKALRDKYITDKSISAFYAVYQNYSKKALSKVFEFSGALGFKRKNLVKTTFEDEALGDLFGEQAVLCGGMSELIMAGFDTLVKNGISPDKAYLEVAYQLDLIVRLIKQYGVEGMYQRISVAARFGSVKAGKQIIDNNVKKRLNLLFQEIKSGNFAQRLNKLTDKDIKILDKQIKKSVNPDFEKSARKFSK